MCMVSEARLKSDRALRSSQSTAMIFPPFRPGPPVVSSGVNDRQLPRKALLDG
jgi:hypothetical protein